eukprot:jgi/Botrbrau1/7023/Bobra.0165s0049.1
MEFAVAQVEEDFQVWWASQNRMHDILGLLISLPMCAACVAHQKNEPMLWISTILMVLNLLDLWMIFCHSEIHARSWRISTYSIRWLLLASGSLFAFDQLEHGVASKHDWPLVHAILISKWPFMLSAIFLFRLEMRLLPVTWFAFLVTYHFSAYLALKVIQPAVSTSSTFHVLATWMNDEVVPQLLFGLRPDISVEQYILMYWLWIQSLVFWCGVWLSSWWEYHDREMFRARCLPLSATNSIVFKSHVLRCMGVQGYIAFLLISAATRMPS